MTGGFEAIARLMTEQMVQNRNFTEQVPQALSTLATGAAGAVATAGDDDVTNDDEASHGSKQLARSKKTARGKGKGKGKKLKERHLLSGWKLWQGRQEAFTALKPKLGRVRMTLSLAAFRYGKRHH
jgi:hypothetical protein